MLSSIHYNHHPVLTNCLFLQAPNRPLELNEQGRLLEAAILAAATEILAMKDTLNEWDHKVGDGDCGSTVSLS